MSADLSQPLLQSPAPRRRALVSLALIAGVALLGAAFLWRLHHAIEESHRRTEAFMKQAVPVAERFVAGWKTADWRAVRSVVSNSLRSAFMEVHVKNLLAAHPELGAPATLLGFTFSGAVGPTFADFFGIDQADLDAAYTFRYQLAKPGQPDGATLTFEVRWEQGEARVSQIQLDGRNLVDR